MSKPGSAVPARALTIPVPPPVQGGWRGTLFSTIALAVEVLLALGRGLGGAFLRVVGRGRGRVGAAGTGFVRGSLRFMVGTVRLLLFVFVLLILGGLATFITVHLLRSSG
jgi:hypothetical protein